MRTCLSWQQLGMHSWWAHTNAADPARHSMHLSPLPLPGSERMEMQLVLRTGSCLAMVLVRPALSRDCEAHVLDGTHHRADSEQCP